MWLEPVCKILKSKIKFENEVLFPLAQFNLKSNQICWMLLETNIFNLELVSKYSYTKEMCMDRDKV